jgi:hypothetical protein
MGVIVAVDLWKKGRYQILNFIKTNKSSAASTTTTMNLYNPAVSHRMRELGLGPYCVQNNDPRNWAQLVCREMPNQIGHVAALHGNDTNPEIWKSFLQAMNREQEDEDNENDDNGEATRRRRRRRQQQQHQQQPPSYVSLSSVYPNCDPVSNHTVLFSLPVMSLKAAAAPVELVYG